jgi:hypothetical protein
VVSTQVYDVQATVRQRKFDKSGSVVYASYNAGLFDSYLFDFYSIALSKIERGNSRDIADVKLLIQQGIINLNDLDVAYQEVLAQLGQGRYPRITPQRFSGRYQDVRKRL